MLELTVTPEPQRGVPPPPLAPLAPLSPPVAAVPFSPPSVAAPLGDELERRLCTEPVVWISSTRPDGLPHVLPIWFSWDGHAVWIFSRPEAQKVRNLRHRSQVMLALGSAHPEFDVELVEGRAHLLEAPTSAVLPRVHLEKYRDAMARAGLTRELYAERYSQPVLITPSRVLDWHARELSSRAASEG